MFRCYKIILIQREMCCCKSLYHSPKVRLELKFSKREGHRAVRSTRLTIVLFFLRATRRAFGIARE